MPIVLLFRRIALLAANAGLCIALCLVAGCGAREEIRPQGDVAAAKAALKTALDAWKTGQSPSEAGTQDSVIWTDEDWRAGKKLSAYQLTSEPEQNGGHWRIYAELTLEDKGKKAVPTRASYAVTLGEPTVILRGDELN
jgi:hypothetical protein